MVEGTAQRLDELRREFIAAFAESEIGKLRAKWTGEDVEATYGHLADAALGVVRGQADALQAATDMAEKIEAMRMKAVWHSAHDRHDHGSMVASGVAASRLRRVLGLPADTTDPNR